MLKVSQFVFVACIQFFSAYASADCQPPWFLTPSETEVNDARPEIRWSPVAGVERYHVHLQSRVPEGKVLVTFDSDVTGTSFTPPQNLTDHRANVTVTVTPRCGTTSAASVSGRFQIDTGRRCIMAGEIGSEDRSDGIRLSWTAVPRAGSYRVMVYAAADGKLLEQRQTRAAQVDLPRRSTPTVAAIQPECDIGRGGFRYIRVAF